MKNTKKVTTKKATKKVVKKATAQVKPTPKFKIGDKVRYLGDYYGMFARVGKITRLPIGTFNDYVVSIDDGKSIYSMPENDLRFVHEDYGTALSESKFKIGDKVRCIGSRTVKDGTKGTVILFYEGYVIVRVDNLNFKLLPQHLGLITDRSKSTPKFKIGDKVEVMGDYFHAGERIGTITGLPKDSTSLYNVSMHINGMPYSFAEGEMHAITKPVTPRFKVGDKVLVDGCAEPTVIEIVKGDRYGYAKPNGVYKYADESEIKLAPEVVTPKFKIGDKVRIDRSAKYPELLHLEGIIKDFGRLDSCEVYIPGHNRWSFPFSDISKIEVVTPKTMDFSEALKALMSGKKIKRECWKCGNMYLTYESKRTVRVIKGDQYEEMFPIGTIINIPADILVHHVDIAGNDAIRRYDSTVADILATDWVIVDKEPSATTPTQNKPKFKVGDQVRMNKWDKHWNEPKLKNHFDKKDIGYVTIVDGAEQQFVGVKWDDGASGWLSINDLEKVV